MNIEMKIKHSLQIISESENFYLYLNPLTQKVELWEKGFHSDIDSSKCKFPQLIRVIG
jgi:hypothetical protein